MNSAYYLIVRHYLDPNTGTGPFKDALPRHRVMVFDPVVEVEEATVHGPRCVVSGCVVSLCVCSGRRLALSSAGPCSARG